MQGNEEGCTRDLNREDEEGEMPEPKEPTEPKEPVESKEPVEPKEPESKEPTETVEPTETPEDKAKRLEDELKKKDKQIGDLQHRVDGLFAKTKELESSKGKEKTWDDLSIEELKDYRRKARAAQDDELIDFINDKIAEKSADKRIKDEADRREANYIRINTWKEISIKYPDLKNQNSEHYQETVRFIQENSVYDDLLRFPEGHARAAEIVAKDLQLRKLQNVDKEKKSAEDKLSKERTKKDLGKGERKGEALGEDENLAKLKKAAEESGNPYSREWRIYLKALEDKQNLKEK